MERKLQSPIHNIAINSHTGAPIKVHPLPIAAPQVTKEVRSTALEGGTLDQVHGDVGLS